MSDDKKVLKLKNFQEVDSDKITPEQLVEIIGEEVEEFDIDKAFCILVDKEGFRYYTAKMNDEEIILAFEAIKMLILASRFG